MGNYSRIEKSMIDIAEVIIKQNIRCENLVTMSVLIRDGYFTLIQFNTTKNIQFRVQLVSTIKTKIKKIKYLN